MKVRVINEKMYDDKIYFISGTLSELKSWVKRKKIIEHEPFENIPDTVTGIASVIRYSISKKQDEVAYLIYIKDPKDLITIVHETNHLTYDALNRKGIELHEGTKEVYAYYQEWLFKSIINRR